MAANETKPAKSGKKETGTVARFRSVDVDGVVYLPGDTVTLPAEEINDLRQKGFLVDLIDIEVSEKDIPKVKITRSADVKTPVSTNQTNEDQDGAQSSEEDLSVKTSEE